MHKHRSLYIVEKSFLSFTPNPYPEFFFFPLWKFIFVADYLRPGCPVYRVLGNNAFFNGIIRRNVKHYIVNESLYNGSEDPLRRFPFPRPCFAMALTASSVNSSSTSSSSKRYLYCFKRAFFGSLSILISASSSRL